MNQNKLYFPIAVSDQQGVKIVSHIAQSMSHDSRARIYKRVGFGLKTS